MRNFFIIGLCLSLTGCTFASKRIENPYADPQYGMSKQQMIELMGRPDSIEIYKKPDQSRVEFYIYVKYYPSSQEKVPVCLIDNKVVGWGNAYYADHVSPDDIRIK